MPRYRVLRKAKRFLITEKTCSTLARTEDFCCSFFFGDDILQKSENARLSITCSAACISDRLYKFCSKYSRSISSLSYGLFPCSPFVVVRFYYLYPLAPRLVILFSLFFSVPAHHLARLALFVLSYLYLIISPSVFLSLLCGVALDVQMAFENLDWKF